MLVNAVLISMAIVFIPAVAAKAIGKPPKHIRSVLTFFPHDQALHPGVEHPQSRRLRSFRYEFVGLLVSLERESVLGRAGSPGKEAGACVFTARHCSHQIRAERRALRRCCEGRLISVANVFMPTVPQSDQSDHQRVLDEVLTFFFHQRVCILIESFNSLSFI